MLTSSETQQKPNPINQQVANVITELGKSILPEFSHSISHEILEKSLKIHYTLDNTEELKRTNTSNICQVLCNFLQFYIVANFIFPYNSDLPAEDLLLTQQLLSFKIHINNTTESIPISATRILSQISFDKITIVTPLKSVLHKLIAGELKQHSTVCLKQSFTLSFNVTFNISFDIEKLNHYLTTNLPVIRDISQLHYFLNLYNTSPITNIFPEAQPTDLKLAVLHTRNPQSRTSNDQISPCLITSTTLPTMFIKHLCNTQYNNSDTTYYQVAHQKLNTLPNPQECSLKYHNQSTTNKHTAIYKVNFNSFTEEKFCKQVSSYANLFSSLYEKQHLKLSIEFSPKEETKAELAVNSTAESCSSKSYPLDSNTETEIREILFSMCDILESNFVSRMFFKKRTDTRIHSTLSQYNIYLHITPSKSISKSTLPTIQTSPSATQADSKTKPQTELTQDTELTTSSLDKQISQISQEIRLKEKATHTLPDPTTKTSSQTQPSTSHAVTPITRASSIEANLQEKCESFPSIPQTSNYTKTAQQGIPTLRKVTKSSQTNKLINKDHYKKNMIFAVIGISLFTASIILVYYALSNRFLANYTDITKINQVVMVGILCLGIIALIGTISYYHIKAPNTLVENTTSDIQQHHNKQSMSKNNVI
ncbi:hypothetical protein [Ehrlichia japonica]|uniref:hypothetical protein n=1 Tax=Ehrlichia japonica TaxID=391036 RepID=UPI0005C5AB7A|nr:hypothetical protein [Ehrlichia japonica]